MMKILMLVNNLARGGKERRLIELLKGLKTTPNIECELVLFSKRIEYPEVFDLEMPIHYLERKKKKDPRIFWKLYKKIGEIKPDLIHSWGRMASVYAIPTKFLQGIPLINANIADAPNGLTFRDKRYFWSQLSFPFSDVILANCKAGLTAYKAPKYKSRCIYNGFDYNRIKQLMPANEVQQKLGIYTPKTVAMVGAFEDRKDFTSYIKAAIQVVGLRKDISFIAVGDGKDRNACEALVPPSLRKRIIFTGQIDWIESLIHFVDIGVLMTNAKVHQEGISNAILEYMVIGKPVIASRGGGTNEIVFHNKTGLLVDPFDIKELVLSINYLLDNATFANELGQTAKKAIQDGFSLDRMKQDFLDLYEEFV